MRWVEAVIGSALLAIIATAGSSAASEAAAGEVRFARTGPLEAWRVELPGRLEASAVRCAGPAAAPGDCEMLVLVRSIEADPRKVEGEAPRPASPIERTVYALPLEAESAALRRVGRIPDLLPVRSSASQLERVETSDGKEALLVVASGRAFLGVFDDQGTMRQGSLIEIGAPPPSARSLGRGGRPWLGWSVLEAVGPRLAAYDVGTVEVFDVGAGLSARSRSYSLPVAVERKSGRLVLRTPVVRTLGSTPRQIAVGPEAHGQLRLRTLLLDPTASPEDENAAEDERAERGGEGPELGSVERWSRLSGPERVIGSAVWWVDSRPVLAVITLRADKIGIFERKKLRVFELDSDRTLAGSRPVFETLTASRMWQVLGGDLVDADGDGDLDLVLVQPEGFGGDKLAVDVYRGSGGMRFSSKAVRSMVPVPESWWRYGDDWSGDGVPDLVSVRSGVLRLFAGRPALEKGFLGPSATVEHRLDSPTRNSGGDAGDSAEEPVQRAYVEQGLVVVRSRYSKGRDLLEVVRPAIGVRSLSVGSIASLTFD